ncbi:hypothetical protein IEQ34_011287 [Dendrobium chrysotoxum]|uniref:Uncharacterized protein n=1 Tax=Dendrobium chrysotoxum TaxID=161865 RepID=A0AAV7GYR1_DENCH|nr:hypothetical protein IEQ34_011287 [Dendrobium chrysotoxum]
MDSVLLQSPMKERSPDLGLSPDTTYELMLRESIKRFLGGIHREGFDFAGFRSVMSRQLQSSVDPPLEMVWLYSAASYHESVAAKNSFDRVRAVRDLLQLLSAFSAASRGAKSIALIAPAVYDLYQCAVEGFVEKKDIECLADGILSYISICSGHYSDLEEISTVLHPCFLDLVKVWTLRHSGAGASLEAFFPLISSEARRRFEKEGSGVTYLAGVVIAEAFLLRLCLKVKGGGASRKELQKELGIWAVSSITAFCNRHFFVHFEWVFTSNFDTLMCRNIVEVPAGYKSYCSRSIGTILFTFYAFVVFLNRHFSSSGYLWDMERLPENADDEKLARGVLYDAVVLVDYSFLFSGKEINQYDRIRNLLVTKLIVTNEAVKIARTGGDHGKAISYLNAYATSSLPSELINLVRKQIGDLSSEKPNNNSPEALLKWLVLLQEMRKISLDDEASRYAIQLISEESNLLAVESASAEDKKMDADLFFLDKGQSNGEEMESMDAVFSSAAQSMKQFSSNGRVKRKKSSGEEGNRFKFVKYDAHNDLLEDSVIPIIADGANSDSAVENPPSDADMEESD